MAALLSATGSVCQSSIHFFDGGIRYELVIAYLNAVFCLNVDGG